MRLVALLAPMVFAGVLSACSGGDSTVCPTGWNAQATAPGGCAAPASVTSNLTGVYGFVRTNAHGGKDQLVVGSLVFVVADSNTTCQAPSVNPIAQTTTDDNGVFTMSVPPGTYRITSGEVPTCTELTVDANAATDVALTSP